MAAAADVEVLESRARSLGYLLGRYRYSCLLWYSFILFLLALVTSTLFFFNGNTRKNAPSYAIQLFTFSHHLIHVSAAWKSWACWRTSQWPWGPITERKYHVREYTAAEYGWSDILWITYTLLSLDVFLLGTLGATTTASWDSLLGRSSGLQPSGARVYLLLCCPSPKCKLPTW